MTDQHRYLVLGSGGFQGAAVAGKLGAAGHEVRGFTRGGAPSAATNTVYGDLADPDALRRAFEGITHASVVLPLVFDRQLVETYATNIATAARRAGLRRLVHNTNLPLPAEVTRHDVYETRRIAERILRDSGVPVVVLRPTVYLDNIFSPWNGPELVNHGVLSYPFAPDRKVAWLSHEDLATATVAALTREDLEHTVLPLTGGQEATGPELAGLLGAELNEEVTFRPLTATGFEAMLRGPLGARTAAGVAGIYHWLDEHPDSELFRADPTAERVLGFRPIPIAEWVRTRPWRIWREPPEDGSRR
ncbi:SDR family oxidoreductase [Actinopolyspora mortivallis]|uniref:NmrA family transcriptional regulator n=1 Tax=Actinopolyspora mortivallis TaxID=33906 RepID=A0A2T0GRV9_ACTMO|nr:NmrA family NAD(P)-binding protein [Actinopolyspora mortivallis]PRW61845.1 NmrA family transcriptional regulator [Actinopolyspora mortivallis]